MTRWNAALKFLSANSPDTSCNNIYAFIAFFSHIIQLVDKMEEYGIASFGVSVTTLEEVFMKVGEGSEKTVDDL